jgi:hypothetical protein
MNTDKADLDKQIIIEKKYSPKWTRKCIIRQLRRPAYGFFIEWNFIAYYIYILLGITIITNSLQNLVLPWTTNTSSSNLNESDPHYIFATLGAFFWVQNYLILNIMSLIKVLKYNGKARYDWLAVYRIGHISYIVVRFALFFGLTATGNALAVTSAYCIELVLGWVVVATALLGLLGLTIYRCYRCITGQVPKDVELKKDSAV